MKSFLLPLLFLITFYSASGNCLNDSTITHFSDIEDDGDEISNYESIVYHTDLGSFDRCTYTLTNNNWVLDSCNSGLYSDVVRSFNSNGQLLEETTRQGTGSGWVFVTSHRFTYNTSGQITSEINLNYNGSSWDTTDVSTLIYNSQNILIENYKRVFNSGNANNFSRLHYHMNAGQKDSVTYQYGTGQTWVNDSMFTFEYAGGVRTAVNVFLWDGVNNAWSLQSHTAYDALNGYTATVVDYDTTISGNYELIDTLLYTIDTLENVLFRSDFHLTSPNGGEYSSETYELVNGKFMITHDFGASIWTYFDQNNQIVAEVDYACTGPNSYYIYDVNGRMIEFDDYSRCGMPNQSSNYYTYDPSGYITDHVYHFESNMHDRYSHDTYSYALGNSIHIQAAPSDNSPKCKGTSFQPGFILSGGCGYVSIHWTPSTGLSSDTVLSPVISFQDSITYTISFTDSNGNTGSYIYTLVPYTAHIVIDNTCNGNTWATLYGETTLDYYTTFSWYLDTTFQSTSYYSYNVNQAGNYFAKVTDYNSGCVVYSDTVTINNPTIASIVHADICSGDQYFLPDGQPVNTTGVYNTTYTSVSGCDSTIVSDVNVIPVLTDSVSDNISVNQQYTLPDGQIVSQPGTYNCTITASTGCDSIVVVTLHGVLATSVNSIQSEQLFTLSPVPVQNDLFIHTKLSGNFDIRINDMLGNVVMMNLSSHADDRISMSTLPAGFYVITVIQEGQPLYRSTIEKH